MAGAFELPFDRMTFHDGQVLASRDFRDESRTSKRRRALHNRYVHQVWGVALGLEVELLANLTGVILHPGYAIDSLGRDVLVARPLKLLVPHTASVQLFALVIGSCPGSAEWIAADGVRLGEKVPLASAHASAGIISGPLDFSVRRLAERASRPRIGYGSSEAGYTGWTGQPGLWIEAVVDTSAAGFMGAPQYLAAVSSGAPGFIAAMDAGSFTFRVPVGDPPFGTSITAAAAENAGWAVSWTGVESEGDS